MPVYKLINCIGRQRLITTGCTHVVQNSLVPLPQLQCETETNCIQSIQCNKDMNLCLDLVRNENAIREVYTYMQIVHLLTYILNYACSQLNV